MDAASAIIGFVSVGLSSSRVLLDEINRIREVPGVLIQVKEELQGVQAVLESLKAVLDPNSELPEPARKAIDNVRIECALKICDNSCQNFHQTLLKWTKHSTQDKTFWWDRVRIGFYGEERIQALRNQLAISKATITMAITTANL